VNAFRQLSHPMAILSLVLQYGGRLGLFVVWCIFSGAWTATKWILVLSTLCLVFWPCWQLIRLTIASICLLWSGFSPSVHVLYYAGISQFTQACLDQAMLFTIRTLCSMATVFGTSPTQNFRWLFPVWWNSCAQQALWVPHALMEPTWICEQLALSPSLNVTQYVWSAQDYQYQAIVTAREIASMTYVTRLQRWMSENAGGLWGPLVGLSSNVYDATIMVFTATKPFFLLLTFVGYAALFASVLISAYILIKLTCKFMAFLRPAPVIYVGGNMENLPIDQVRSDVGRLAASAFAQADLITPVAGSHNRLAAMRRIVEKHLLQYLFTAYTHVTDIGGSLRRNQIYAGKLHICLPNESPADQERLMSCGPSANDIGQHRYKDCPKLGYAAISIFSANHLTLDELAKIGSRRLGLVVEHCFSPGTSSLAFSGVEEASINVTSGYVTMTTTGGNTYEHPYYRWKTQGLIIGTTDACYYRRVAYSETYKVGVFALYPFRGFAVPSAEFPELRRSIPTVVDDQVLETLTHTFRVSLLDNEYVLRQGDDEITFPRAAVEDALMRTVHLPVDNKYMNSVTASCHASLSRHEIKRNPLEFEQLVTLLDKQHRTYHHGVPLDTILIDRLAKFSTVGAKVMAPLISSAPRFLLSRVRSFIPPAKREISVPFVQAPTATFVANPGPRSALISCNGPTPFRQGAASNGGHGPADDHSIVVSDAVQRERNPLPKHQGGGPSHSAPRSVAGSNSGRKQNHKENSQAASINGKWRKTNPVQAHIRRDSTPKPCTTSAGPADKALPLDVPQTPETTPPPAPEPAPVRGVGEAIPSRSPARHERRKGPSVVHGETVAIIEVLPKDGGDP